MSEFRLVTNKDFRRRAWELCRQNFWAILGATFLVSLVSTAAAELATLTESSILASVASILLLALSWLMSLGMVRFILDVWHGEPTSLSTLFSQKNRFWTFVCVSLLDGLICLGAVFAVCIPVGMFIGLMVAFSEAAILETLCTIFTVIVAIALVVLVFWISMRFVMTTTCIVLYPEMRATDCMRTAWRASKGNVKRLFCNAFVLNLPLYVANALLMGYQSFLLMNGQTLNIIGSALLNGASVLLSALLSGYIYLGTYSLHEYLLNNTSVPSVRPTSYSLTPEELGLGDPIPLPPAEEEKKEE